MAAESRNKPRGPEMQILPEDLMLGHNLGLVRTDENGRMWVPRSEIAEEIVKMRTVFRDPDPRLLHTLEGRRNELADILRVQEYYVTEEMALRATPYLSSLTPAPARNAFLSQWALEVRRQ